MLRWLVLVLGLVAAVPAGADPGRWVELELGYSGVAPVSETTFIHGWQASLGINLGPVGALLAEAGGSYAPGLAWHRLAVGGRAALRSVWGSLFAEALVGVSILSSRKESEYPPEAHYRQTEAYPDLAVGGGIDVHLSRRLALRLLDLRVLYMFGAHPVAQLSTGLVVRLGRIPPRPPAPPPRPPRPYPSTAPASAPLPLEL